MTRRPRPDRDVEREFRRWVATFAAEMRVGRLCLGEAVTEDVLNTALSGPIVCPMILVTLAFLVAAALLAAPLIAGSGPLRWPAVVFLVGTLLLLAEVITGQKLLSQIGILLILGASATFSWLLARGQVRARLLKQLRTGQTRGSGSRRAGAAGSRAVGGARRLVRWLRGPGQVPVHPGKQLLAGQRGTSV